MLANESTTPRVVIGCSAPLRTSKQLFEIHIKMHEVCDPACFTQDRAEWRILNHTGF